MLKIPPLASAFVPAVLLGESEPKGVAETSQKAAELVVSIYRLCLHIISWCGACSSMNYVPDFMVSNVLLTKCDVIDSFLTGT